MAVSCAAFLQGAVHKKPRLPPRFRFTTGRGGLGIFAAGQRGNEGLREIAKRYQRVITDGNKGLLKAGN